MKNILTFFLSILSTICLQAQNSKPEYNKALADSLHADDYGMKMYVLVILKSGENKTADKATTDSLFTGHMKNINHLAETGKLVVAGPIKKNDKNFRGIFILNTGSLEEANAMLLADPAIQSKVLNAELYEWYGSAALPLYLKYYKSIEKKSF